MPFFSKLSRRKLATAHKQLQILMEEVIKHYDCTIVCGYRGKEEQNKAYANGHSKLQFPKSKHNSFPSLAIDVYPYPISFKDPDHIAKFKEMGKFILETATRLYNDGEMEYKIVWGGNWKKFKDYPHFEIVIE